MDNFISHILSFFKEFWVGFQWILAIFMVAVAFVFARAISDQFFKSITQPIPVSHKIAVLGLPGSGKTTLITALFELIQLGVHIPHVRLHGISTIKSVNRNVALLNSGRRIGPTSEKDIFVFRFSYIKPAIRRFPIFPPRGYDVEIADFPGEYSKDIAIKAVDQSTPRDTESTISPSDLEYTLLNQEFFSWIASSREYLFLIDLVAIYSANEVRAAVADITARIRTSWQVIEDATSERGLGSANRRNVYLVFSKFDSLQIVHENALNLLAFTNRDSDPEGGDAARISEMKKIIAQSGEKDDLSEEQRADAEAVKKLEEENNANFVDLLQFFRARVRNVDTIYTSMALRESDGSRLGVRRVLEAVLP